MPRRQFAACAALLLTVPAAASAGTITGTAYLDRNSNGTFDTAEFTPGASGAVRAGDEGVGGVVVNAYDNTGARVGTATTSANGTYSLTASATGTVRIEFGTPAGYQPSFRGARNRTSVQFVSDSATGADFAVLKTGEYCQDNPSLVTCFMPYLSNTGLTGALTLDARGPNPLTINAAGAMTSSSPSLNGGTTLTTAGDIGATFGVGVDRGNNAYFGTYVKRHSPYGPAGAANAIYKVNRSTGATSTFVTLGSATLPAHVAAAPANWPNYSGDGYRSDNNSGDVFHSVGRAGLGDVDVSPDGSTVYAVEMTQAAPKLWTVPINGTGASATAGTPTSYAIPAPSTFSGVSCSGDWHPMGIGMSPSKVLIGGVCGDERATQTSTITSSQGDGTTYGLELTTAAAHDLRVGDIVNIQNYARGDFCDYLVQASSPLFEVTSVPSPTTLVIQSAQNYAAYCSAAATTGSVVLFAARHPSAFVLDFDTTAHTFTPVAAVDLGYAKGLLDGSFTVTGASDYFANKGALGLWRGWNDGDPLPGVRGLGAAPQPMLANIETRADGSLVLGFRDRWMDQTTRNAIDYDASAASPALSNSYTAGAEALVMCKSGSSYTKESGGACGATTGASMVGLLQAETDPALRQESPLFYWDGYAGNRTTGPHGYTGLGGLTMMPGNPTLWSTAYDVNNLLQQGVRAMGPCASRGTDVGTCGPSPSMDGAQVGGTTFSFYSNASVTAKPPAGCAGDCFGKGNGLGDLEVACDAAPVEIGNRVWIDSNANGVQDPGETPVAGVTVRLYNASNQLVGTATTNADGEYYFDSNVTEAAAGTGDHVGGGLIVGEPFTIRLDKPEDFYPGGPLAPYDLTQATQTSTGVGSQSTAVDSNATVVSSYPQITVPSRGAGFNNHTFDVGFVSAANPSWPQRVLVGMGNYTWIDADRDGTQDPGESPLPGVQVQLLDTNGNPATDADGNPVAPVTTDAQGAYFVGNLLPGQYRAQFTLPSGYAFTTTGGGTSTSDSNPSPGQNPLVGTTPVFTIAAGASGDTSAVSGRPNAAYANLTIDAGVVPAAQASEDGSSGSATPGTPGGTAPFLPAADTGGGLTPYRGGAIVPPRGIPSQGRGSIVVVPMNPLDAPVDAMTTVVVVPKGFTVVSTDGGRVKGRTITYTDADVPAKGRRAHQIVLRASGRARTVSIPVTVTVAGSPVVQRTILRVKVRRTTMPAVTG